MATPPANNNINCTTDIISCGRVRCPARLLELPNIPLNISKPWATELVARAGRGASNNIKAKNHFILFRIFCPVGKSD